MKQNNRGLSLVELVVAIAILGAFSVSICTCLVLSLRMNEKTDSLLKEQLAVSSAVETLMAEGITEPKEEYGSFNGAKAKTETVEGKPYFKVTVTSDSGNVTVTTQIRKAVPTS